jgi:hypothetical protein
MRGKRLPAQGGIGLRGWPKGLQTQLEVATSGSLAVQAELRCFQGASEAGAVWAVCVSLSPAVSALGRQSLSATYRKPSSRSTGAAAG